MTTTVDRRSEILAGEYPGSWDDFIGQEAAKRLLKVKAAAARMSGQRLDHVLLESPHPGIGKTSLALLIGAEMDVQVSLISAPVKAHEARVLFSAMEEGSICLYDEIHLVAQGGQHNASWLLHYLENGILLGPRGVERNVPQVTVIGTTTDAGRLPQPVIDRFAIRPPLSAYNELEGTLIASRLAQRILGRVGLEPASDETCARIARAASNRPRLMRDLLGSVRDLAIVGELEFAAGEYDLTEPLVWAGLTEDGLTKSAQDLLLFLYTDMGGAPAGEKLIRERLGLYGTTLTDTEGLLTERDLMINTKAGRMLTQDGIRRARALIEEAA